MDYHHHMQVSSVLTTGMYETPEREEKMGSQIRVSGFILMHF